MSQWPPCKVLSGLPAWLRITQRFKWAEALTALMLADIAKAQIAVAMVQHSTMELETSVQAAVYESLRQ